MAAASAMRAALPAAAAAAAVLPPRPTLSTRYEFKAEPAAPRPPTVPLHAPRSATYIRKPMPSVASLEHGGFAPAVAAHPTMPPLVPIPDDEMPRADAYPSRPRRKVKKTLGDDYSRAQYRRAVTQGL